VWERLDKTGGTPVEQLKQVVSERFKYITKNPAIAAVIFSEEIFQNEKQLSEKVYMIMQDSQEIIRKVIEKGQQSGQFRTDLSADRLSILIMGGLRLLVTQWRLSGFSFDLQIEGQKLWKSVEKIMIC